jgi:selenide,water dikinase
MADIPFLPQVKELASAGCITGASARNFSAYGHEVVLNDTDAVTQALLCDPQTSGGLLIACAPDAVEQVLELFHKNDFQNAAVIGEIIAGPAQVHIK